MLKRVLLVPQIEVETLVKKLALHDTPDFSNFFDSGEHFALKCDGAVALFEFVGVSADKRPVYNGHYLFPTNCRGKKAVTAAKEMINTVFTFYSAAGIVGEIPRENRAARVFTRCLGFKPYNTGESRFGVPCVYYMLKREEWETFSTPQKRLISSPLREQIT